MIFGDQDTHARRQTIDHHKDHQMQQQKEGKGEWKKELSSNSEAAVRIDVSCPSRIQETITEKKEMLIAMEINTGQSRQRRYPQGRYREFTA